MRVYISADKAQRFVDGLHWQDLRNLGSDGFELYPLAADMTKAECILALMSDGTIAVLKGADPEKVKFDDILPLRFANKLQAHLISGMLDVLSRGTLADE